MTIIAASHTEMAADRLITGEGAPPIYSRKIGIIGDSIYGGAGDSMALLQFLDWRKRIWEATPKQRRDEERDCPVYDGSDDDFECLQLRKDGELFYWTNACVQMEILNTHYALGTGDSLAIHYMDTGKTPKRACELVMRANKWAVGTIDVLTIGEIGG